MTILLALASACNGGSQTSAKNITEEVEEQTDSVYNEEVAEAVNIFMHNPRLMELAQEEEDGYLDSMGRSLNEIRFDGWTRDDFFGSNNQYLRAFRQYIDAWMQGKKFSDTEMDPTELEPYRKRLTGKFIAAGCEEFMFGGMLYYMNPVDAPDLMLKVWLYSYVERDGSIGKYEVRYIEVQENSGYTKADIEEYLTEYAGESIANLW